MGSPRAVLQKSSEILWGLGTFGKYTECWLLPNLMKLRSRLVVQSQAHECGLSRALTCYHFALRVHGAGVLDHVCS
jgi:hypothetical protein